MTTPFDPNTAAIYVADPLPNKDELGEARYWLELAKIVWLDAVPTIEVLDDTRTWKELADCDNPLPVYGLRVVGFPESREVLQRGPLLQVRHPRATIPAFEHVLRSLALTTIGIAPEPPGALTKVVERSQMRVELDELRALLERSMENVTRRLAALEQGPSTRVLEERLNWQKERMDELTTKLDARDHATDVAERLERDIEENEDAFLTFKRAAERRMTRLDSDLAKVESDLAELDRGRRR